MTVFRYARSHAWSIGLFATFLFLGSVGVTSAGTRSGRLDFGSGRELGFVQTPGQMSAGRDEGAMVLLPSGKVLIAGGMGGIGIIPTLYDNAEIFDPQTGQFTLSNGHMASVRTDATGTLLPNGKVLITGGINGSAALASADVYDPATDSFSPTANAMSSPRVNQTATLLANGTVLIAAGNNASSEAQATADIYDPSTNRFTLVPNLMTDARTQAAAALLQSGAVLIVGGGDQNAASAEIYDPTTQTFTATAHPMTTNRFNPQATLLPDGGVLISGGRDGLADLASTEIYEPDQDNFVGGPTMSSVRLHHFSILMPSGQVLLGGGDTSFLKTPTASADLYDPQRDTLRPTSQPLRIGRSAAPATSAVVLQDGRVFVAGGQDEQGDLAGLALASGEIYDPAFDSFTITGGLNTPRNGHTATLLSNGTILLVGGADNARKPTSKAELYNSKTERFTRTASPLNVPRVGHAAVRLRNGRVLIVGGSSDRSAEIYDPRSDNFTLTTSMMIASRIAPTATLLANGQVLIAGGLNNQNIALSSAELYDPRTDSFTAVAASMTAARAIHAAARLGNGKVLLAGGSSDSALAHALDSAEIYDPRKMTFTATKPMASARVGLAIAVTPRSALVTGGNDETTKILDTGEVFVGSFNGFVPVANVMTDPREFHTATALPGGKVLIAGGDQNAQNATDSTDFYNPRTNSFEPGPTMTAVRDFQTATKLPSGQVLVAGGRGLSIGAPEVWPTTELLTPLRNGSVVGRSCRGACTSEPAQITQ